MKVAFTLNGTRSELERSAGHAAGRGAARRSRPHRHQDRLRCRRLRRLHGAARRPAGLRLPGGDGPGRGPRASRRSKASPAATARSPRCSKSFLEHGAAQCGICTPGMLMAAQELLRATAQPSRARGRGCAGRRALPLHRLQQDRRCGDGRRRAGADACARRPARRSVRASPRVDGTPRSRAATCSAPMPFPADALWIRVVRSPHARARFELGDLAPLRRRLAAVLTAADVPFNGFGIYPDIKDQPVLADGLGALSRRGGAGAGRRARRRAGDPRRRGADRLDARAAGARHRCRDGGRCAAGAGRQAGQPAAGRRRAARRCGGGLRRVRRRGRGRVRDRLRRARLYRARGRLGAARRRPHRDPRLAPRRPTWTATRSRTSCGCSPKRCASCRPPAAAASAASSTSRCSR